MLLGALGAAKELCRALTKRGSKPGAARQRLVECKPLARKAKAVEFTPSCRNKVCACDVSYADFRSGWSYRDAHEMVGGRGRGGTEPTYAPSQRTVVRMLARLKRDEWKRHQEACAAGDAPVAGDFDVAELGTDWLDGLRERRRRPR